MVSNLTMLVAEGPTHWFLLGCFLEAYQIEKELTILFPYVPFGHYMHGT
jgi:hypothetical protein